MIIFEPLSQQTIMSVGQLSNSLTRWLINPKWYYYFGVKQDFCPTNLEEFKRAIYYKRQLILKHGCLSRSKRLLVTNYNV